MGVLASAAILQDGSRHFGDRWRLPFGSSHRLLLWDAFGITQAETVGRGGGNESLRHSLRSFLQVVLGGFRVLEKSLGMKNRNWPPSACRPCGSDELPNLRQCLFTRDQRYLASFDLSNPPTDLHNLGLCDVFRNVMTEAFDNAVRKFGALCGRKLLRLLEDAGYGLGHAISIPAVRIRASAKPKQRDLENRLSDRRGKCERGWAWFRSRSSIG